MSNPATRSPRDSQRSPTVAAVLSFLWPGLGHWYLDRPRLGAVLAFPIAVLVLVLLLWLSAGIEQVIVDLLIPSVAVGLALALVVAGALRIGSMAHAAWLAGGTWGLRRPLAGGTLGVLALVVVVTHLWAASVAWSIFLGTERVFAPGLEPPPIAGEPGASAAPTPSDPFLATPEATPETEDSRINILFTGIDNAEHRNTTLTDTLIVVSLDPLTGKSAMISFPRDIARFTMSNGVRYNGKINSLMTYANNHPDEFPGGGLPTLIRELGHILGVPIHYFAAVDLDGFRRLIDATGGIDVDNPRTINDPTYTGWPDGRTGFQLSAGRHHLDGETALAYVRTRRGVGDNDFTRARRQQQVLVALRGRLTDPAMLPRLPELISIASDTVRTNFPRDRIDDTLDLVRSLDDDRAITRLVLGPPYAVNPPAGTPGGYQLVLDLDRIAEMSIDLFGGDSEYAQPS